MDSGFESGEEELEEKEEEEEGGEGEEGEERAKCMDMRGRWQGIGEELWGRGLGRALQQNTLQTCLKFSNGIRGGKTLEPFHGTWNCKTI